MTFNKQQGKLEVREFLSDGEVDPTTTSDAIQFWLKVLTMKSPMGEKKYCNLADLYITTAFINTSMQC